MEDNRKFRITHDVKVEPVEESDWGQVIAVVLLLLLLAAAFGGAQ